MYDFDKLTDRTNTRAAKWERYRDNYPNGNYYPLWLADMDFPVSKPIQDALVNRAMHPVYGYTDRCMEDRLIFADRFGDRYRYAIDAEEVILSTGVMYSIAACILLFTEPGDSILIITPCYPPFVSVVTGLGRKAVTAPMKFCGGRYCMDMELLGNRTEKGTKAVLLCNPHNPTGRVFSFEELEQLALFCEDRRLLIFSDEIHCDFVYPPAVFHPIMMINKYAQEHTVAMVSPTKSFNLAGLKISAMFVKNRSMNKKLADYASLRGIGSINLFALAACRAAYEDSGEWQEELLLYLEENKKFAAAYLRQHMPEIRFAEPEGTYFYWLDFRNIGHPPEDIHGLLGKNGVILNEGCAFEEGKNGFERLNMACPQWFLEQALAQIKENLIVRGD